MIQTRRQYEKVLSFIQGQIGIVWHWRSMCWILYFVFGVCWFDWFCGTKDIGCLTRSLLKCIGEYHELRIGLKAIKSITSMAVLYQRGTLRTVNVTAVGMCNTDVRVWQSTLQKGPVWNATTLLPILCCVALKIFCHNECDLIHSPLNESRR